MQEYGPYDTAPIIKQMRLSRGITQKGLARLTYRARSYIAVLETRAGSCRFDTLAEIAEVLGYEIIIKRKEDNNI